MAHPSQQKFVASVKAKYPQHFKGTTVLEAGSFNVNGSVRPFFESCAYLGIDVCPGEGVDIISSAHNFDPGPNVRYDTIITCEMMEHNPYWEQTLTNLVRLLKPGGLLVFTCATTGRPEHGTTNVKAGESPSSQLFGSYYKNLSEQDIRPILEQTEALEFMEFSTVGEPIYDIYLVAKKKGEIIAPVLRGNFTKKDISEKPIHIFYHMLCSNDHLRRFFEFKEQAISSGLIKQAALFHVVLVGGTKDSREQTKSKLIDPNSKIIIYVHDSPGVDKSEKVTLDLIKRKCQEEDIHVLYAHGKGVTTPHSQCQDYWRKYMTYYCVNFHGIMPLLLNKHDAVGCQLTQREQDIFYAGNMWWSTSRYINKLTVVSPSRMASEHWIGSHNEFNLVCLKHFDRNLYTEELHPEEYRGSSLDIRFLRSTY